MRKSFSWLLDQCMVSWKKKKYDGSQKINWDWYGIFSTSFSSVKSFIFLFFREGRNKGAGEEQDLIGRNIVWTEPQCGSFDQNWIGSVIGVDGRHKIHSLSCDYTIWYATEKKRKRERCLFLSGLNNGPTLRPVFF